MPSEVSTIPLSTSNNHSAQDSNGSSTDDEEDMIFMTFDSIKGGHDSAAINQLPGLVRSVSLLREKQITVDPISLQGSKSNTQQPSFGSIRSNLQPPMKSSTRSENPTLPHLPPPKSNFLSASLPISASPSPRSGSTLLNKIWKNKKEGSPRVVNKLWRQYSAMDDIDLAQRQSSMRRSKSMREGRLSTPVDDFDLMPEKPAAHDFDLMLDRPSMAAPSYTQSHSFHGPEEVYADDLSKRGDKEQDIPEEPYNCGKLCLFLPRGKRKPVRASSTNSLPVVSSTSGATPAAPSTPSHKTDAPAMSRTVSLERFDCGSWASPIAISDEEKETNGPFFDLPMEFIRCSVSDVQSPVTAAFVFNKDAKPDKEPKGVLKKTSSIESDRMSKSRDSAVRHVRFSISSNTSHPSSPCITPRLRKARDDFNAFLEAQRHDVF